MSLRIKYLTLIVSLLIASFGLSNVALSAPTQLTSTAACDLITGDTIPTDVAYSFEGHYLSDGMHGQSIEIPGCRLSVLPDNWIDSIGIVAKYKKAFKDKCGGYLMGNNFDGVFTGTFVARTVKGMYGPMTRYFFGVNEVESQKLDPSLITCGKRTGD